MLGKMIFKIVALVALVKVCACDSHMNYHEPHSSVKHAVSSQSFVRHDVPISYKHSEVHIYSTEKPHSYGPKPIAPGHSHQLPKLEFHPQEIQYAPIVREKKTEYTEPEITKEHAKKINLEPNLHNHPNRLALVPGYNLQNLQVLQSVNRYPGHNAVYRSYSHANPSENNNKQHDLNQLAAHDRKPETTPSVSAFDFVPKQYKTDITNTYETETELAAPQLAEMNIVSLEGYPPHPKTHRMLVNIARAYNFARQTAQAPKSIARQMRKPGPVPKQNKVNQQTNPKPTHLTHEIKTRLFPVKYKSLPQYSQ